MIFNKDECLILIAALEEYSVDKPALMFRQHADDFDNARISCLNKLEHLTMLTNFTSQEYTVMCIVMDDIIKKLPIAGYKVPDGYYELGCKLAELADTSCTSET